MLAVPLRVGYTVTRKGDRRVAEITDVAVSDNRVRLYKAESPRWITEEELLRDYYIGKHVYTPPEGGTKLISKTAPRFDYDIAEVCYANEPFYRVGIRWLTEAEVREKYYVCETR